jgi:hypothetical protein
MGSSGQALHQSMADNRPCRSRDRVVSKAAFGRLLASGVAPKGPSGRGLTGRIRHPGARHQSPSTGVRVRLGRAISYDRLQRVPGRAA